MDQRLKEACQKGNIDAFYASIREDPHLLENIDKIPFVDTPLHIAVEAGQTEFALEIMRLKPSFARKPNQDGFSPLHLALQKGQTQLVLWLVEDDPDLIRVKGREGITPLHFVAGTGDLDLLAKFLSVCPKSVEDLTIQRETALHVALKNNMFKAFEVLAEWLLPPWYDRDGNLEGAAVLNSKDMEGNTVLHIAASMNRPQVIRLLIKSPALDVNAKNSEGLTALDILHQTQVDSREANNMLCRHGALRASKLPPVITVSDYLMPKMPFYERWIISIFRGQRYMSSDSRNALLVVAVLIATTTYQAGLSPPGGLWQDDYEPPNLNTTSSATNMTLSASSPPPHYAGHPILPPSSIMIFTSFNSIAFLMSISIIYVLLPTENAIFVLLVPLLIMLGVCHIWSVLTLTFHMPLTRFIFLIVAIFQVVVCQAVRRTLRKASCCRLIRLQSLRTLRKAKLLWHISDSKSCWEICDD